MSKRKVAFRIFYYFVATLLCAVFIAPILWMVLSSFKDNSAIFKDMNSWRAFVVPRFTLDNYVNALKLVPLHRYALNSLLVVGSITVLGLAVNSLCGYALAKLRVPFQRLILAVIISLIVIPFQSIIIPVYLTVNGMGLMNTMPALILPFIASCYNIYLFRQFFTSIPKELEEAAYIDGASVLRTFVSIVVPLSKANFATVSVLTFTGYWSDFLWPLMVTQDDSVRTVQLGLQFFFTEPPYNYGNIMAGLTMGTIPMVLIFLFFQRYYVQGITAGGVKG